MHEHTEGRDISVNVQRHIAVLANVAALVGLSQALLHQELFFFFHFLFYHIKNECKNNHLWAPTAVGKVCCVAFVELAGEDVECLHHDETGDDGYVWIDLSSIW